MISYDQRNRLNSDNQTILAISLAMERIEKRNPNNFRKSSKWKKLHTLRELYSIQLAKKELQYYKDRYDRIKDKFSAMRINQYQNYIDKYENKGESHENKQL